MAVERLEEATRGLPAPLAAVDLGALDRNADDLVRRAGGLPLRIATKSVRCRAVLDHVLARPGVAGLMAYSLPEALWLAANGATDVLVAYPSVDRAAFHALSADADLAARIAVVVDDPEHLRVIRESAAGGGADVRVCLDVDASWRIGPLHVGVRRSPVHTVDQARTAARVIAATPGVRLVGLMLYDAQLAGVPDASAAVRVMKRGSAAELRERRRAVVEAVRQVADLEFVNGGGTGSLDLIAGDPGLTELAAGSGLYGPTLFDGYRGFTPEPALAYALPVTRRPARGVRTLFGGGYVASGPVGPTRAPSPVWPRGLRLLRAEGAGEVQTPVTGPAVEGLAVGDRVWFRHAKAGEVCERFDRLHLVSADGTVAAVPTYRGEGQCFG